jgi:hypothetical protein
VVGRRVYIAAAAPRRDYGVALNDDFSIDENETAKLRAQAAE